MNAIQDREQIQEEAANWRAGVIASTIVNANPYRRKGARAARPKDFFRFQHIGRGAEPPTQDTYDAMLRKMGAEPTVAVAS